jgi:hypothetical protein
MLQAALLGLSGLHQDEPMSNGRDGTVIRTDDHYEIEFERRGKCSNRFCGDALTTTRFVLGMVMMNRFCSPVCWTFISRFGAAGSKY